ncbi:MAG TPA: hypothetical protein VEW46_09905 [Pyrinomonadaceae bacterium]|nr:hypothetical protein [Pyrinomonadaceae bacterium]
MKCRPSGETAKCSRPASSNLKISMGVLEVAAAASSTVTIGALLEQW